MLGCGFSARPRQDLPTLLTWEPTPTRGLHSTSHLGMAYSISTILLNSSHPSINEYVTQAKAEPATCSTSALPRKMATSQGCLFLSAVLPFLGFPCRLPSKPRLNLYHTRGLITNIDYLKWCSPTHSSTDRDAGLAEKDEARRWLAPQQPNLCQDVRSIFVCRCYRQGA